MTEKITLGDMVVDVMFKDIKNIHLSVHPPTGNVRISAPLKMDIDTIRVYAISRLSWIKTHQRKLREQDRETPREYLERESHYVWGERYLLRVKTHSAPPMVMLSPRHMDVSVRPGSGPDKIERVLAAWYREQVRGVAKKLITKWEPVMGVNVSKVFVQRMKTRWGSCTPDTRSIRLNTELAKKPRECLEYIVVHEMVHLLESTHNARFVALMDQWLPDWRELRKRLNRAPLSHAEWTY
ncbi:MAG: SprT family zinc-dependent metalloprotease [Rhodospirillaceae bacterium]